MTCDACAAAEVNPQHGMFFTACGSCQARQLALSPMAHRALAGDRQDLQDAIAVVWKDDYEAGRKLVWRWMEVIKSV